MNRKILLLFAFLSSNAFCLENTGYFNIENVFVSAGTNMHFRVEGMGPMSYCPDGTSFAYVNENDSGAQTKISTLLAAYLAQKRVSLVVKPTSVYSDSRLYCQIIEFKVKE